MKSLKRLVCLLLALMLTFCIGCNQCAGQTPPDTSGTENGIEKELGEKIGELCKDGMACYDIVIPSNAGDCIRYASEELVSFVKQATGVALLIKEDSEAVDNILPYVSLGNTIQLNSKNLEVNYEPLKKDGFVIKSDDKNLYVVGNTERSILYGVYEFLERFVGIKFLTYDYTYIPTLNSVDLFESNIVEIPAFDNRTYLSNQLMHNTVFAVRMRMNNEYLAINDKMKDKYGGKIDFVLEGDVHSTLDFMFGHANHTAYINEPLYLEHSEWFFAEDGKVKDICFSKVGLTEDGKIDESLEISPVKIFVERLKEIVIRDSHANYFMIGQEDYIDTCECETCLQQETKYKRSGMLVRFINAIANEINDWKNAQGIEREINIVTFAYYYTQTAPLNSEGLPLDSTVVPAKNVFIRLAPITAYGYFGITDERQHASVRTLFSDWSKITDRFFIWSYHTCYGGYFTYYPTMHHWQEDFKLYNSMNTAYVLLQSAYSENVMWTNHMETYVASKMLWDVDRSAEELKKEFIYYYYAGFGELISEFIDNFDIQYALMIDGDDVAESERPLAGIGGQDLLMNPSLYTTAFWERQFELLELADKKIDTLEISDMQKEIFHSRVAAIRLTPQFMVAMKYDFYYSGDVFGKNKFLEEMFTNMNNLGVVQYRENGSIDALKTLLGYKG